MNEELLTMEWVRERVRNNEDLFTLHGDEERRNDLLGISDIEEVLMGGRILEVYSQDKRGPPCLVAGRSKDKPVHVVCGKNKSGWLVIITVYIPSKPKWESPTQRS